MPKPNEPTAPRPTRITTAQPRRRLLPCPFCGRPINPTGASVVAVGPFHLYICEPCGRMGVRALQLADSLRDWLQRSLPAPPTGQPRRFPTGGEPETPPEAGC